TEKRVHSLPESRRIPLLRALEDEVSDLARGVDAGVGSPTAHAGNLLARHSREGGLKGLLDAWTPARSRALLLLPSAERCAHVGDQRRELPHPKTRMQGRR